ncbi:uncharacterized protein B0H18DRAFT_955320 [Fomitopsis serialis]|uniref:uncharacterized protein n=1 Tax=Fomitopsis serialis TaxID=139415 RepID=UPI00200820F5|nr:uncharacterized protein B0H18DRAFT_955320 [Neoantrodia serialis]KAH9924932.1 hypothetical protein B0H18DRAFT_955320 [Neoantrodia serialis]
MSSTASGSALDKYIAWMQRMKMPAKGEDLLQWTVKFNGASNEYTRSRGPNTSVEDKARQAAALNHIWDEMDAKGTPQYHTWRVATYPWMSHPIEKRRAQRNAEKEMRDAKPVDHDITAEQGVEGGPSAQADSVPSGETVRERIHSNHVALPGRSTERVAGKRTASEVGFDDSLEDGGDTYHQPTFLVRQLQGTAHKSRLSCRSGVDSLPELSGPEVELHVGPREPARHYARRVTGKKPRKENEHPFASHKVGVSMAETFVASRGADPRDREASTPQRALAKSHSGDVSQTMNTSKQEAPSPEEREETFAYYAAKEEILHLDARMAVLMHQRRSLEMLIQDMEDVDGRRVVGMSTISVNNGLELGSPVPKMLDNVYQKVSFEASSVYLPAGVLLFKAWRLLYDNIEEPQRQIGAADAQRRSEKGVYGSDAAIACHPDINYQDAQEGQSDRHPDV